MTLVPDDFTAAHVDFVPLSLRDVKLQKSEIVWADIGGNGVAHPCLCVLMVRRTDRDEEGAQRDP